MRKRLKAFTLVELLAAMAIIAILIGIAGFGISIALRGSRDSQREKALDDLQIAITDYLSRKNVYPASIGYSGGEFTLPATSPLITVAVSPGAAEPAGTTDGNGTLYKYAQVTTGGGYVLCAYLENDTIFELGTSATENCGSGQGTEIQ